jgi:hypothetical protein
LGSGFLPWNWFAAGFTITGALIAFGGALALLLKLPEPVEDAK